MNQHAAFIPDVAIAQDNQVARAVIWKPLLPDGVYTWIVTGPCWSTYEETDAADTLDAAKKAVDERVMKIIEEEFELEPLHPLG